MGYEEAKALWGGSQTSLGYPGFRLWRKEVPLASLTRPGPRRSKSRPCTEKGKGRWKGQVAFSYSRGVQGQLRARRLDRACTGLLRTQGPRTSSSVPGNSGSGLLSSLPSIGPSTPSSQVSHIQALRAFQRSLSVLLMLPVWQGMEAISSK